MKNLLKYFPFCLLFSLSIISCGDDDDPVPVYNCVLAPSIDLENYLIGEWLINGADSETVHFESDGTGFSSEESIHFTARNDGKGYHTFDWEVESDTTTTMILISYDYSPDTPVEPFILTQGYSVLSLACDQLKLRSGLASEVEITR